MIAEVIINSNVKSLNKTFDYKVPENLNVKIGTRVSVPFGNSKKKQDGYVIGLKETTDFKVKEIIDIVDDELTKENIELALLMARRYFCNISDCIKLMLPPGTTGRTPENRVKEKTGLFVYLKKDIEEIENDIEEGIIKAPKQIRYLEFLKENEGIHVLDIEALTDTTRAITKALEKKEYIEIVEQKIERNPFEFKKVERDKALLLTNEQQESYDKVAKCIDNNEFKEFLLYGVTGSRKN